MGGGGSEYIISNLYNKEPEKLGSVFEINYKLFEKKTKLNTDISQHVWREINEQPNIKC